MKDEVKKNETESENEVHMVEEPKVSKLGFFPSLPTWVCIVWYGGFFVLSAICQSVSYDVTINTVEGAEFFSIFMKLSCLAVQRWLSLVGLFGGILTFYRKRKSLAMFFSWYTVISIFIVGFSILGFIF